MNNITILTECLRRASRARTHEHMLDLMVIAGFLRQGLTEAEIEQATLAAEI